MKNICWEILISGSSDTLRIHYSLFEFLQNPGAPDKGVFCVSCDMIISKLIIGKPTVQKVVAKHTSYVDF